LNYVHLKFSSAPANQKHQSQSKLNMGNFFIQEKLRFADQGQWSYFFGAVP
jgi:hypothetical protein